MMVQPREVEAELRRYVDAGQHDAAVALAVAAYGAELLGFLRATGRDHDLADEAFSFASERLWQHIAKFRWEATLRTYFYQLARNALHHLRIDPKRRPERNLPLSIASALQLAQRVSTPAFQRTSVKDALSELRDKLEPDDHELLILRLDRGMSWKDVARALADEDDLDTTLTTRAAALRKRYERVKAELRELAIARGLIDVGDD